MTLVCNLGKKKIKNIKNLSAHSWIPVKHGNPFIKMTTHKTSLAGRAQT